MFDGKSLLITGGTGSFGKAFIRRMLSTYRPRKLVVFSRDEFKQYEMQQVFPERKYDCMRYYLGDVRDFERLKQAFNGIDYVVHAAALKHVPAAEYNPFECIKTNVYGAENVINAAIYSGVKRVVALSTDKAANPINLYGATKFASDRLFVAANLISGQAKTIFSVVRYGNVLGSRGSVVPLFEKLIAQNQKTLPITDLRMTRFWITLDQGVNFVIRCLQQMEGGELFVPKIPSMRIVDLAKALAPDCEFQEVGIRPGEKIHEVMITADDARNTMELDDCYVIQPPFHWWDRSWLLERGAKPVPEDFVYASHKNSDILTPERLRKMLEEQRVNEGLKP